MSKDLIAAITLEAMARNYANGNLWDDLDREAVREAARVIREQEAEIERLRQIAKDNGPFTNADLDWNAPKVGTAKILAEQIAALPAPAVEPSRNAVSAAEVIRWKTATSQTADMLRAAYAIDSISPAPVSDEWKTMESAPKDGSRLLAFSPSAGHRLIRWASGVEKFIGIPSGVALVTATHWLPLPLPPLPTKAED